MDDREIELLTKIVKEAVKAEMRVLQLELKEMFEAWTERRAKEEAELRRQVF